MPTKVTDIRVSQQAEMAVSRAHSSENRWPMRHKVHEWKPLDGKCILGKPPAKWTYDLVKIAGTRRIQTANSLSK